MVCTTGSPVTVHPPFGGITMSNYKRAHGENHNHRSGAYKGLLVCGGIASAVALIAMGSVSASAVAADGSTNGHVEVGNSISLSGLTSDFTISGVPGETTTLPSAVGFTVVTNNLAGYDITVQSATSTLVGDTLANSDSIPIADLSVSEDGETFTPLSSTVPSVVHSQSTRSAEGGDALTNDYRVVVPFVSTDTYTVTLDYVASTL
jgi:hypothetical protein